MYVFHDEAGNVTFTATGGVDIVEGRKDWIEVPFVDLGDLTAWQIRDGSLFQVSLDPAKRDSKTEVNTIIGAIREKYLTNLPGQEMIYLRKEQEARDWLASDNPDLADYPLMQAEVGVTADTPYQLAQIWLYMSYAWVTIAANLEGLRMATAAKIDAAMNPDEITSAMASFAKEVALEDDRL